MFPIQNTVPTRYPRTEALQLFGLTAVILALGCVYWLIREQDRRDGRSRAHRGEAVGARSRGRGPSCASASGIIGAASVWRVQLQLCFFSFFTRCFW
jgi:hypothetical protein